MDLSVNKKRVQKGAGPASRHAQDAPQDLSVKKSNALANSLHNSDSTVLANSLDKTNALVNSLDNSNTKTLANTLDNSSTNDLDNSLNKPDTDTDQRLLTSVWPTAVSGAGKEPCVTSLRDHQGAMSLAEQLSLSLLGGGAGGVGKEAASLSLADQFNLSLLASAARKDSPAVTSLTNQGAALADQPGLSVLGSTARSGGGKDTVSTGLLDQLSLSMLGATARTVSVGGKDSASSASSADPGSVSLADQLALSAVRSVTGKDAATAGLLADQLSLSMLGSAARSVSTTSASSADPGSVSLADQLSLSMLGSTARSVGGKDAVTAGLLADHLGLSAARSVTGKDAASTGLLADQLGLSVLGPTARMVADLDQYLRSLAELRSSSLAHHTLRSLAHHKARSLATAQSKRTAGPDLKSAVLAVPRRSALVVPKPRTRAVPMPEQREGKSEQSRVAGSGQDTITTTDQGLDLSNKATHTHTHTHSHTYSNSNSNSSSNTAAKATSATSVRHHSDGRQLKDVYSRLKGGGKTKSSLHRDKGSVLFDRGSVLFDRGSILPDKGSALLDRQEAPRPARPGGRERSAGREKAASGTDRRLDTEPGEVPASLRPALNSLLLTQSSLHVPARPLDNGASGEDVTLTEDDAGSRKRKRKQERPQKRVKMAARCPSPSSSPSHREVALPATELLEQVAAAAHQGALSTGGLDAYFSGADPRIPGHSSTWDAGLDTDTPPLGSRPLDTRCVNAGTAGSLVSGTAEGVAARSAVRPDPGKGDLLQAGTALDTEAGTDRSTATDSEAAADTEREDGGEEGGVEEEREGGEVGESPPSPASSPDSKAWSGRGKATPARVSVSLHNRQQRKALRLYGKEYTTPSGKTYPQRQVRPKDCSKCRYNCSASVSPAQRQALFLHFWSLDSYVKRLYYYCQSIKEKPAKTMKHTRECCREYTFLVGADRVRVCKGFYLATLDVSDKAVRIAMEKRKRGKGMWGDKRGPHPHPNPSSNKTGGGGPHPHGKARMEEKERVRAHIERVLIQDIYAKTGANSATTPGQDLDVGAMHRDYADLCRQEGRDPLPEDLYRHTFSSEYDLATVQV